MPLVYDSIGGQYWFFNENNLLLFDIATQKVKRVTNHTHPDLFKNILRDNDYEISNMMLTPDRNLWFSTWSGPIGRINLANGKTTGYSLKKSLRTSQNPTGPMGINLFYLDNYGQLWATTYGAGLLRYNVSNDNFDYILSDRSDPQSLWYNYELKSLFQDAQDNIWVGTDIGISIFNPYQENFQILKHNKNNPSSLPPNEIETILQASNKEVWVGTWGGGITVFDSSLNFKKHMTFESTAANMVWSFMEDDRNRVWVGCQRGMIMRYDLHSKKFEKPFYIENNRSTIRFMTKDKSGNLYLGMQNGNVIKWDAFTDAFIFPDDREIPGTRPPVSYLYIDSLDNLWVNIGTAIMKYDTKEMKLLKRFPLVSSIIEKSKIPTISSISPFNDSLLAVSNAQGSGGFLNTRSGKFEKWNLTPTAGSRRVSAIKKDKNNHIWFASGWDLFRFTPGSEHKPTNYIVEKHLLGSPFFTGKTAELSDGRWAFFTSTEVLIFKPENLGNNTERKETGSLAVTGFKIFGEKRPIDSLLLNNLPVYLNHTENYITIEFSPLVYTPLQENKYVYKLTGINSQWLTADENFSVTYTSLDPGNYTFMIKLDSEEEPEKITSFRIVVRPPFWKTWWFYFLCTLAASGLAWLIIGWKIKGIRKEANLKRKVLETEMAALRAQMNPHFIFNCINAIDSLIQNDEKDKATTYLARFARLIRNILDSSNNNVVPFHKDFETTKLFIELEKFRSSDNFEYELYADRELLNGDYKVPPLLMQPFIENAIHHGLFNKTDDKKFLEVKVKLDNDHIIYTIRDNGVGRTRAEELKKINKPEHKSYGIHISKERIRNHNDAHAHHMVFTSAKYVTISDIYENDKPAGTSVELKLKIGSHL